jgi:hypothetical protein
MIIFVHHLRLYSNQVRKGYTPVKIINKLREAEVLLSPGDTVSLACKKIGTSDYTYYRRRKEYGVTDVDQAKKLKELEVENSLPPTIIR